MIYVRIGISYRSQSTPQYWWKVFRCRKFDLFEGITIKSYYFKRRPQYVFSHINLSYILHLEVRICKLFRNIRHQVQEMKLKPLIHTIEKCDFTSLPFIFVHLIVSSITDLEEEICIWKLRYIISLRIIPNVKILFRWMTTQSSRIYGYIIYNNYDLYNRTYMR
jgi:hypothetical protein